MDEMETLDPRDPRYRLDPFVQIHLEKGLVKKGCDKIETVEGAIVQHRPEFVQIPVERAQDVVEDIAETLRVVPRDGEMTLESKRLIIGMMIELEPEEPVVGERQRDNRATIGTPDLHSPIGIAMQESVEDEMDQKDTLTDPFDHGGPVDARDFSLDRVRDREFHQRRHRLELFLEQ